MCSRTWPAGMAEAPSRPPWFENAVTAVAMAYLREAHTERVTGQLANGLTLGT